MLYTPATKKAMKLCFAAHKDQVDKSGVPYVFHPFHLAEQMQDEQTTVAALLHDVAEDSGYTPEDLAAMAEAGSVKVLIPHHMDLAMSEDMYLPRIEEMERAVHARVPGCTVITPERLKWYHMGLSVWA